MSGRNLGLALAAVLLGGCSAGPRPAGHVGAAADEASFVALIEGCGVQRPSAWSQAVARGRLALGPDESLVPVSVTGPGTTILASRYAPDWSGVQTLGGGQAPRRIHAFAHPATDAVLGAATDGRYIVWSETHTLDSWDDWTLWSWDSRTGLTRHLDTVGHADGHPLAGPMLIPAADRGRAAWTGPNADGSTTLHLVDLDTGRAQVVRRGHPAAPVFFDGLLVWPESPAPGALSTLRGVDPATAAPATLPGALAQIAGAAYVTADGTRLVWESQDYRELWTFTAGAARPARLLRTGPTEHVTMPQIAGDLIVWSGDHAMFAVDLRSGSFTQLTREYGLVAASRGTLEVSERPAPEPGARAPLAVSLVDATTLPRLPGCGAG